ncbi:MAG: hypothetical protein KAT61_05080, partial [Gammaproteobacteria bacterium]|nr:hypothetical protein [Gammaproteobacteria bacterium]
ILRCTTDPLKADTDGDGMHDGGESVFFANPTLKDLDNLTDDDHDGLLALEEINGWLVEVYNIYESLATVDYPFEVTKSCSTVEGSICDFKDLNDAAIRTDSNSLLYDTDGDGLSDYEEREIGTHPRIQDTDGDGLTDFYEEKGFTFDAKTESQAVRNTESPFKGTDSAPVITSAIVEDYDADGISDGEELTKGWIVSVGANSHYVYSTPRHEDVDLDGLIDGDERIEHSDPNKSNTDEDQQEIYPLNDGYEVALGLDPTDPTDMCVKVDLFQQELSTKHDTHGTLNGLTYSVVEWRGTVAGQTYYTNTENVTLPDQFKSQEWLTFYAGAETTVYVILSDIISVDVSGRVWFWDTSGDDDVYFDMMTQKLTRDNFVENRQINISQEQTKWDGFYLNKIRGKATVMTKSDVEADPENTFCQ